MCIISGKHDMSGDRLHGKQPIIFYSSEMSVAKKILLEKLPNEIVEIQGVRFQQRWRKGSLMEE
tara:strand:+ start:367 stop:558 length:192 start_codon:yes stop_codon:yes gene_type:complete